MPGGHGVGRISRFFLALALAWSLGLIVIAAFGPVYASESTSVTVAGGRHGTSERSATSSERTSLVEEDGAWTLVPVAVPALLTLGIGTRLLRSRRDMSSDPLIWVSIALLTGFAFISVLSVGAFLVPVALFLALATAFAGHRASPASPNAGV